MEASQVHLTLDRRGPHLSLGQGFKQVGAPLEREGGTDPKPRPQQEPPPSPALTKAAVAIWSLSFQQKCDTGTLMKKVMHLTDASWGHNSSLSTGITNHFRLRAIHTNQTQPVSTL